MITVTLFEERFTGRRIRRSYSITHATDNIGPGMILAGITKAYIKPENYSWFYAVELLVHPDDEKELLHHNPDCKAWRGRFYSVSVEVPRIVIGGLAQGTL